LPPEPVQTIIAGHCLGDVIRLRETPPPGTGDTKRGRTAMAAPFYFDWMIPKRSNRDLKR